MNNRDLTSFLDARQNQLQLEVATGDAIDTKALGILASDFALLLFIAQPDINHIPTALAVVLSFLISIAIMLTCRVIWPKNYAGASTSSLEHPEYLEFNTKILVRQLIADTETALAINEVINKKRWSMCIKALILTLITTTILLCRLYL